MCFFFSLNNFAIGPFCNLHQIVVGTIPGHEDWKTELTLTCKVCRWEFCCFFFNMIALAKSWLFFFLLFFSPAPCFRQADGRAAVRRENWVPSPPAAARWAGKKWGREAAGRAWNGSSLAAQVDPHSSFVPASRENSGELPELLEQAKGLQGTNESCSPPESLDQKCKAVALRTGGVESSLTVAISFGGPEGGISNKGIFFSNIVLCTNSYNWICTSCALAFP